MEYLTTVEMSKRWNISSRRIGVLCTEGRVEGAIKKGKMWLIPSDAVKPVDGRFKVNKVEAKSASAVDSNYNKRLRVKEGTGIDGAY